MQRQVEMKHQADFKRAVAAQSGNFLAVKASKDQQQPYQYPMPYAPLTDIYTMNATYASRVQAANAAPSAFAAWVGSNPYSLLSTKQLLSMLSGNGRTNHILAVTASSLPSSGTLAGSSNYPSPSDSQSHISGSTLIYQQSDFSGSPNMQADEGSFIQPMLTGGKTRPRANSGVDPASLSVVKTEPLSESPMRIRAAPNSPPMRKLPSLRAQPKHRQSSSDDETAGLSSFEEDSDSESEDDSEAESGVGPVQTVARKSSSREYICTDCDRNFGTFGHLNRFVCHAVSNFRCTN
jgi:hypothetical protein